VAGDVLGQSDGNPDQTFYFRRQHVPILEGESLEVREWAGRGMEWETIVQDVPEADLRFEHDLATNSVKAVWVRWHERPHLFNSGPASRHYMIERARGWLRFGDGRHGRIPPAGARLIASFDGGGGVAGNLPAGAISELRTGVPYLQSFTNPVAAAGGAAVETLVGVQARGPQRLRHRDRAVSAQDFEWLARDASPAVARSRCLPLTGPVGQGQFGWVTVVIVPYGEEAQPQPTPELLRRVREYLAARAPASLARQVRVMGPRYTPVGIVAEVTPQRPEEAAQVEARLLARLSSF
jgi:predicted phage baseplate assembly protein